MRTKISLYKLGRSELRMRILAISFLFSISISAFAQIDNRIFDDTLAYSTAKKVYWQFDNLGFLRNTEFFGPQALGATLFGFQTLPKFHYQISEKTSIVLGGFVWKDFGNSSFTQIRPFFRMNYRNGGFSMNLGNLQGNLQHKLLEPVFDYERVITNRLENGLQILYQDHRLKFDTWIDWTKMIYKNSPFQEEFHQGIFVHYDFLKKERMKVGFQLQNLFVHRGGQIQDSSFRGQAYTVLNSAVGLVYENFKTKTEVFALYYGKDKNSGRAIFLNTTLRTHYLDLTLSYFLAHDYQTQLGMPLYSSQSNYSGTFLNTRELIFLRLIKDFRLDESNVISLRLIPYLDLGERIFEYSYELYWRMNLSGKL